MNTGRNPMTLTTNIELEAREMALITEHLPRAIVNLAATRFVEENWEAIKKNKKLMSDIKAGAVEQATERIAALIEKRVADSLLPK